MPRGNASTVLARCERYYTELWRFLSRKLANHELAADVTQETFLRLARVDPPMMLIDARAYMFRIASNLLTDMFRRNGRQASSLTHENPSESVPPFSPSAEETVIARERLSLLHGALAELPPNCQQALLLNRLEGLTHAQIALRLGVSESMVAKYIAQALRHCRDRLERALH
jgi:RNA polymerase sigma-70 factor (ECF subfamily)